MFLYLSLQDHFLTLQFIINVLLVYQLDLHLFKLQDKKKITFFHVLKAKKKKNPTTFYYKIIHFFLWLVQKKIYTISLINTTGLYSNFFFLSSATELVMERTIKVSLKRTASCKTRSS